MTSVSLEESLIIGISYSDNVVIRKWRGTDRISELTAFLHRGYKSMADKGMHFVASHQSDDVTKERSDKGTCLVAVKDNRFVGTIALYDSKISDHFVNISDGYFGQYTVDPLLRSTGLGSQLLSHVEEIARERGMKTLAFDTSELATDLIKYYERRGYRFIGYVKWDEVNYRSVTMLKQL
jgi:GNAT superfamily N-acetyltransferase